MSDLDLDVAFNINSAEVDAETTATRERIRTVGAEARTQGQAAGRSFNGLQNSLNQISRELPAFTVSAQTGFLAISNNLPILFDELTRVREANAALTASGQTAQPVWKQLVNGLLSWQTALSLGVTLLTVYGKDIVAWAANLFKGKAVLDAFSASQKVNSQIQSDAIKNYAKETAQLMTLKNVLTDRNLSETRRNEALEQYNKIADAANQIDKKSLDNSTLIEEAINRQIVLIQKRGLAKASENVIAEKAEDLFKKELDFNEKYPRYNDDAIKELDNKAANAIKERAAKLGIKDYDTNTLLAQALLPDAELAEMAKQDKRFQVLTDAGTKKILDSVNERKKQLQAIRNNDNGGYEGVKQGLIGINEAKAQLDIATNAGMKYINAAGAVKPTDTSKADASAFANIIASRKGLLDKLAALDAEYSRKSLTKDEEEKQALKDKFTEFRNIIADENAKIAEYNKTHKKQVGTIDVGAVDPIEKQATADLEYRQATDKLKTSLDEQKKLYKDYEDYKTNFGEAKANERFKGELDTSKTYLQKLTEEYTRLTDQQSKAPLTGVQKERLKMVGDGMKAEQKLTEDNIAKLLADLQTYDDKRTAMQEAAMAKIQGLQKRGNNAEADNLRKKSEAELTEFDKKRVEQMDSYKQLFDNVDRMSTTALRKSLTGLQAEVNKLTLTPKAKEFFDKMFGDLKYRIDSQTATDFKNIASALGDAAQYAAKFDEGLASALSTAAELAGQVGNIKQDLADFKVAKGDKDIFGQITAGLGILGSAMGVISSIGGLFSNAKQNAEQQKYTADLQLKATEAVNKALERQLSLTKEIYGPERLAAYKKGLDDIKKAQEDSTAKLQGKLTLTGNKVFDDVITKVNNGEKYNELVYKAWIEAYKQSGAAIDLTKQSLEQLTKLMDEGKLDEKTAAIVQSMIDLDKQARDTRNALTEEITGVSFDSLNEKLKAAFADGKTEAKDFADVLESVIKDAFTNSFERNEVEKALQPFYDQLYKAGEDGVFSDDEIKTLREQKDAIAKVLADKAAAYEKIIGSDDDLTNDSNSLQGAYKTASQESIDLLSANTGGLRLAAVEGNNLAKAGNKTMADTLDEIKKQTLALMDIANNTKDTASNTGEMKDTLKSIDRKMDDNKNYNAGTGRVI